MEQTNVVNDTQQAVVESAKSECVTGGADAGTPALGTKTELAVRSQTKGENSAFRKLRIQNEQYQKEIESLKSRLGDLSELDKSRQQRDIYLDALVKDKMQRDLDYVKGIDPFVTDLAELGEDFIRLIENGVDIKLAYNVVKQASSGRQMPSQPTLGQMGQPDFKSNRYFTSKELDRLSAKDLEDPKIYKKAIESLKRL